MLSFKNREYSLESNSAFCNSANDFLSYHIECWNEMKSALSNISILGGLLRAIETEMNNNSDKFKNL